MARKSLAKSRADHYSSLWMRKADRQWSINIHSAGKCAICGGHSYLQAHHLIPREIKQYRYSIENGILLCVKHHKYDYVISAHKNPLAFTIWLQNKKIEVWNWVVDAINNIDTEIKINYHDAYIELKTLNDNQLVHSCVE